MTEHDQTERGRQDEMFLSHISNILCAELHGRMSYLGFLVTINIAIYAGLNLLTDKGQSIWQFSLQKTALLLILIFVNFIFTVMYLREHNITRIRDSGIRKELGESSKVKMVAKVFHHDLSDNDCLRGITWWATKLLLAVFNALPLAFLIVFLWKEYLFEIVKGFAVANNLYVAFVTISFLVTYWYLSIKSL